jgi:hypothetical protein
MKDINKKIGLLKEFIVYDGEQEAYYYNMDKEYEDIRELWYEYRDEVIDLHDQYVLQYLDEALESYLEGVDEEILTTTYLEDFNLYVEGDDYTTDLTYWLYSHTKRVWVYGQDSYEMSMLGKEITFEELLRRAQELEKEQLGRIAKEIIIDYLELR